MSGQFEMRGICPVCGKSNFVYNPYLPVYETKDERLIHENYPWTVFRCYHNGTAFHDDKNYSASAGTLYPMHLYFMRDGGEKFCRVYPNANDDCNRRHWKVKKVR